MDADMAGLRLTLAMAVMAVLSAGAAELRISEIMPNPWDGVPEKQGTLAGLDPNGLESGWVEVENTTDHEVDLADYRFVRVNRGKKVKTDGCGNFPSWKIPARGRTVFYTSERYANSTDMRSSAFATPVCAGRPMAYAGKGGEKILVWPGKVNPKKFPFVRLYHAPGGAIREVVDTVVIPGDLPKGASVVVGDTVAGQATRRWVSLAPTRNAANPPADGLTAIGPNVGPLHEARGGRKTRVASEFDRPVPPAKPGSDYAIAFAANPVMNPDGTPTPRAEDALAKIELVYRRDLDDATLKTRTVDLSTKTVDAAAWGDEYRVSIPAGDLPAAGRLVQWKFRLTDKAGSVWTSPAFLDRDDGYEWYGTIVEPTADQLSPKLATWHLFADAATAHRPGTYDDDCAMNQDALLRNGAPNPKYPKHGPRVAIYDSSTSNYYDYVRIDRRGHSSRGHGFKKYSHGLRFAKAHPLTMRDCVADREISGVRKTSLVSEYADVTYLRQLASFWLLNRCGSPCPYHFPVRVNLNGEFYQLAFNSGRFTDELVGDFYGFDKFGWAWKSLASFGNGGTGGSMEKVLPGGGDKYMIYHGKKANFSDFFNALPRAPVKTDADRLKYARTVVEKMDLPAWINYMALSRIVHETDDTTANLCGYYDCPDMVEGARGTGTWRPLAYDLQASFGVWYWLPQVKAQPLGLTSNHDTLKSHPLGMCYTVNITDPGYPKNGRGACRPYEAICAHEKFRRLYLRRLRTLMDSELGAPDATGAETWRNTTVPVFAKMREIAALMKPESDRDRKLWGIPYFYPCLWQFAGDKKVPANVEEGLDDLWNNYVVPRRRHLFVTHSADNAAKGVGFASELSAGIPRAQSPIAALKAKLSVASVPGGAVVRNLNDEAVDLSGWTLSGAVAYAFPAGAVVDRATGSAPGEVFVVLDRLAYVRANRAALTDQVILGNAVAGEGSAFGLVDAAGETVVACAGKAAR